MVCQFVFYYAPKVSFNLVWLPQSKSIKKQDYEITRLEKHLWNVPNGLKIYQNFSLTKEWVSFRFLRLGFLSKVRAYSLQIIWPEIRNRRDARCFWGLHVANCSPMNHWTWKLISLLQHFLPLSYGNDSTKPMTL